MWSCLKVNSCPCKEGPLCGIRQGGPLVKSYHFKAGERPECYLEHVMFCIEEWHSIAARFTKPIVHRFASTFKLKPNDDLERDIKWALTLSIINHDVGKLTLEYQTGKWYRHELLGAYIVRKIFNECFDKEKPYFELLRDITAASVYLHHEALQLSRGWRGLRSPTLDYLMSKVSEFNFTFKAELKSAFNTLNEYGGLTVCYELPNNIEGKDLVRQLGEMISALDGSHNPGAVRLVIALMLLPLTIIDDKAAKKGRG